MGFAIAALHFIALGVGFTGVILRGLELRSLLKDPKTSPARLLLADNLWGFAALLWVVTGLIRLFGPFEKGSSYYLQSHWFWLKMSLFLLIFILEVSPMITFVRWRVKKKTQIDSADLASIQRFILINNVEILLLLAIPFCASIMARGGLY